MTNDTQDMPAELKNLLVEYTDQKREAIERFLGAAELCGYRLRADLAKPTPSKPPCKVCANEAEPGRVETDNNGPIVDCWGCSRKGAHHAPNQELFDLIESMTGKVLVQSELNDIIHVVLKNSKPEPAGDRQAVDTRYFRAAPASAHGVFESLCAAVRQHDKAVVAASNGEDDGLGAETYRSMIMCDALTLVRDHGPTVLAALTAPPTDCAGLVEALEPFAKAFDATLPVEAFDKSIKAATGLLAFTSSVRQQIAEAKVSFNDWKRAAEAYAAHRTPKEKSDV